MSSQAVLSDQRDLSQFDPFRPDVQEDLVGWFAALRRQDPIHFHSASGRWFITSREAIDEALSQPLVFSSEMEEHLKPPPPPAAVEAVAAIRSKGWAHSPSMVYQDPPAHDRLRALVQKAFTVTRVRRLGPDVAAIADRLLDELPSGAPADFVGGYAVQLPALVMAQMLNVADVRLDDFRRWADLRVSTAGQQASAEQYLQVAESEVEMQRYFAAELDRRRAEPIDDLLTALLDARLGAEDEVAGEPLSTEEILSMLTLLLVAGIETTTNLITSTIRFIGERPAHWAWIREDPAPRAEQFVEEALRYFSPVKALPRITRADTSLGGVRIPGGSVLYLIYAAANRDDEQYAAPNAFDLTRPNPRQHLAFGHGKHFCLGAPLARLETQVTLRRMTERFEPPVLSAANTYPQRSGWVLPGLDQLLVELTPRSRPPTSY